jgi:hypothetical protein
MPWVACTSSLERRAHGGPNVEGDFDREQAREGGSGVSGEKQQEMAGECILMEITRASEGNYASQYSVHNQEEENGQGQGEKGGGVEGKGQGEMAP